MQIYTNENEGSFPWWNSLAEDPAAPAFFTDNIVVACRFYPIHNYLIGQERLLHCPSSPSPEMDCENGDPNNVDGGKKDSLRNSYQWWRYDSFVTPWNPKPYSVDDVARPSDQFILYDVCYRYYADIYISYCHKSDAMKDNGANVTYVDGHTEWVPESDDWQKLMFWAYYFPPDAPSW